jgi:hypothetical protein
MNPKDFRIGNLVDYEGKVYEIESISEEYLFLNTDEFGIGVVEWNDINEIWITEDWLIKLGFKKNVLYWYTYDKKIVYNFKDKLLSICDYGNFSREFVHEIQNLIYELTDIELKPIEL